MTDKQIITKDVDVKGCKFFSKNIENCDCYKILQKDSEVENDNA